MTVQKQRHRLATGLLCCVTVIFFASYSFREVHLILEWVAAFSEAAMIGALADWFAVTALFRHPLGLPIPHTAIIPAQQEKLAPALAKFVRSHLLSEQWLSAQIREKEIAKKSLLWLGNTDNIRVIQRSIAASDALSPFSFQHELINGMRFGLHRMSWRPPARSVVEFILDHPEKKEWISSLLSVLAPQLSDHEDQISIRAKNDAPFQKIPLVGSLARSLTGKYSRNALNKIADTIRDASNDLNHPLYQEIDEKLIEISEEIFTNPDLAKQLSSLKSTILDSDLWSSLGFQSSENSTTSENKLIAELCSTLTRAAEIPEAVTQVEHLLINTLQKTMEQNGSQLERMMSEALLAWDSETLSQKIEERVGGDLQFIRVNGTLVGGLIGICLHALKQIF